MYTPGWRVLSRSRQKQKKRNRRQKLIQKFEGICQQCFIQTSEKDYTTIIRHGRKHRKIGPTFPTVEHIVPRCLNGNGEWSNLTLLCLQCNGKNSIQNQRDMITAILEGTI